MHGSSPEGGHQQLKDANHDGWLEPGRADGRLKFAIRMLFTALEGGQQQFKNANRDGWLEPGTGWCKRVCGEGAWSGG